MAIPRGQLSSPGPDQRRSPAAPPIDLGGRSRVPHLPRRRGARARAHRHPYEPADGTGRPRALRPRRGGSRLLRDGARLDLDCQRRGGLAPAPTTSELFGGSILIAAVGGTATALVALACAPLAGDRWWLIALPAAVRTAMLLSRYQEGLFTAVGDVRAVNIMTVARAVMPLLFIGVPLLVGASERTAIACWVLWWVALAAVMYLPSRARSAVRGGRASGGYYRPRGRVRRQDVRDQRGRHAARPRRPPRARACSRATPPSGCCSVAIAGRELVLLAAQSIALSSFHDIGVAERSDTPALTMRAMRHVVLLAVVGSAAVIVATLVLLEPVVGPGFEEVPGLIARWPRARSHSAACTRSSSSSRCGSRAPG